MEWIGEEMEVVDRAVVGAGLEEAGEERVDVCNEEV